MPIPSQIFFIVATVGFWLTPQTMLLSVDWVIPQIVLNLLRVIFLLLHISKILLIIASVNVIKSPTKKLCGHTSVYLDYIELTINSLTIYG